MKYMPIFFSKKSNKLIFFCNTAWSQHALGDQEEQPRNGFLNFNIILQMDLFCKQYLKWRKFPYMQVLVKLYQDPSLRDSCHVCVDSISILLKYLEPDLITDPLFQGLTSHQLSKSTTQDMFPPFNIIFKFQTPP